jgi:hypothetical protein
MNDIDAADGVWARHSPSGGDCGPDDGLIDRDGAISRLEEAGRTLLALPTSGYSTKLRSGSLDIVRSALESYGWGDGRIKPAIPPAAQISRMDEALGWISFIPLDRYVLRRIVGVRALVHPITGRYLYSWRRLARVLGADHKAIQRWHSLGLDMIVSGVNERRLRQR